MKSPVKQAERMGNLEGGWLADCDTTSPSLPLGRFLRVHTKI